MNLKKILFVCGSLEPGQDGVGDYTRELAGAVQRLACNVLVIAIMDRVVDGVSKEKQSARSGDVNVVRLSQSLSFQKRKSEYQKITSDFDPSIISLQYVPYAFSPKGIPFTLRSFLPIKNREIGRAHV